MGEAYRLDRDRGKMPLLHALIGQIGRLSPTRVTVGGEVTLQRLQDQLFLKLLYLASRPPSVLGHENRKTTEIYLHSMGDLERQAIEVFEQAREKSHTDSHTGSDPTKKGSSERPDNPSY